MIRIITSMGAISAKRINCLAHPLMDINHRVIGKMLTYATEFKLYFDMGDYIIGYGNDLYFHIDFDWHELKIHVIECVKGEDKHHYFKSVDELEKFYDENVERFKIAASMFSDFKPLTEYFPLDDLIRISFWNNVLCEHRVDKDGKSYFEYSFDDDCDEDGRYVLVMKFPHEEDIYHVHAFRDAFDSARGREIYEHMDDRDDIFVSLAERVTKEKIVEFVRENL